MRVEQENVEVESVLRSKGRASDDVRDYHPALAPWGVTPREAEVARLVAAGYGNREIADELGISLSTVKANVSRLLRRLEVRTRGILNGEVTRIVRGFREKHERRRRSRATDPRPMKTTTARATQTSSDGRSSVAPGR